MWMRTVRKGIVLPLVVVACTVMACQQSSPTSGPKSHPVAPPPPPAKPADTFHLSDKVALMERHYIAAIAAHDALIRGDTAAMRRHLAELSAQALPANAPDSWKPLHAQMRKAATSGQQDDPSAAMAWVVNACGQCHQAFDQGPRYRKPLAPKGETQLQTDMLRHQWATERLWEGVTKPWDDAWIRGAAAMAKVNVFSQYKGVVSDALRSQEATLRRLGVEAGHTQGLAGRARLYGSMLATCAGCHLSVGVTLKPVETR